MPLVRSELRGDASTILVVVLPRALTGENASLVRDEVTGRLPNADGAAAILDCSEVTLINSIGITCLLQVQDHCRRFGARMYLASVPPAIRTFLRQVKLDGRFPAAESVDDAVRTIEGPAR
jgi:anti-anti-sigma factor